MAWRFKASKFKNAAPIVPKPEACIRDICVGSYQTYGNNITASAAFMAFNVDHNGSSLAVLPIDDCGRKSKTMPLLYAHTDTVTDMDFSPFHDGLLATGSQDCLVKVWHIPEKGLEENLTNPECTFSHKQRRVETVCFHPTVDGLLTTSSYTTLTLWDITAAKEVYSNSEHTDVIQSVSWKKDGRLVSTSCKDKQLRVIDPRTPGNQITHTANGHQSIKDSRVVWLGDTNRILTTGFDMARQREVYIRDLRNFEELEKTLVLDSSTGILIPLYDADTGMLFLAGKGDTTISYLEVIDRDPYLIEGIRHSGEQTKGACLVPKRALNVMQAEVNRVLQLTSSSVVPIMYQVPRKSYRDFHGDLFPDTAGAESCLSSADWLKGADIQLAKISLDPSSKQLNQVHRGSLSEMCKEINERLEKSKQVESVQITVRNNIASARNMFEKDNNENNELRNKHIEITTKRVDDMKLEVENDVVIAGDSVDITSSKLIQNGSSDSVVPPKPLPRRTSSISESEDVPPPKPAARPRTNSVITSVPTQPTFTTSISVPTTYKPRLGPKPFTPPKLNLGDSMSSASELDRVFSVPAAPGNDVVSHSVNGRVSHSPEPETEQSVELMNGGVCAESPTDVDSGARTPSTAERVRLFEAEVLGERKCPGVVDGESGRSAEVDGMNIDDKKELDDLEVLERGGTRSSIAERRRLYESRSQSVQEPSTPSPTPLRRRDSLKALKTSTVKEEESGSPVKRNSVLHNQKQDVMPSSGAPKRTSTVFGRVSKFRHLKGTPAHKSAHIENVRNISRQISGECDGFHANRDRVAVPLSGPGGKIAVFELSKTGKLADGVIPALVHGTNVMDFAWDPFNTRRLAVACDDGTIRLWIIPEGGLTEPTNMPDSVLEGHSEKIYFIKFHPLASDVLASGSYDMTVRIWDLSRENESIVLHGHTDQMFSLSWSPCGKLIATVCKDSVLRVYEPRVSTQPITEGKGPVGSRGARVVWALDGAFIVVTGFDKVSERQILVYKRQDLSTPLATVGLDVSPAILIPFYDEDSSTLFLTGKGDLTIYAFEVCCEPPYLCPLSHHRCSSLHQGLSFLDKKSCDVSSVEFAKALRLTNTSIEPLSFTVPRIKSDLFQDDLFPPTKVTWEPTKTASEWFSGVNRQPKRISLKPPGMDNLSDAQGGASSSSPVSKEQPSGIKPSASQSSFSRGSWTSPDISVKQKQEQIQRSVSSRMEVNMKLEQDHMEGVDEREWDE